MSYDVLSRKMGSRLCTMGAAPPPVPSPDPSPTASPSRKFTLGTMAIGTLAGLAIVTSPWWRPAPRRPYRDPMSRRIYIVPGSPANDIMWSRR